MADKEERIQLAMALIEMVLRYGAPAVIAAIQSWEIEKPTVSDIKALTITADPEDFF